MEIDSSVIIVTVLNVLILFWFLRKKLFVPVTNFMNSRTESIEKRIADSEEMLKEAEFLKDEYNNRLKQADIEGKKIIQEYKDKAENLSNDIIEEANKEAELIRARAKRDVELEMKRAQDEIRDQIVTLSLLAASKAVEEQLDNKSHHKLIKQFISEVGA